MAFHTREYEVYLILGNTRQPALWHWSHWQKAAVLFEPLTVVPRGPAAIRVNQTLRGDWQKNVRFGRLSWSAASHMKWTHGSPVTARVSKSWKFASMEAWAPSWHVCEGQNRAPDFFFQILNLKSSHEPRPKFNPIILCAAGVSMPEKYLQKFSQAARDLAKLVNSRLFAHKRRAWGIGCGGGGFEDSVMDIAHGELFKANPHKRPTDLRILAEKWEHVH